MAGGTRGQVAEVLGQRRGVAVEVHENERTPGIDRDRQQPVIGAVELLDVFHVEDRLLVFRDLRTREQRRPDARPVEIVRPAVVRAADEALDAGVIRCQELRASVAADVVERPQLPVPIAHDEDGASSHLGDEDVAGLPQLGGAADGDPARPEDPLALEREEGLRRVGLGRERLRQGDGPPRRGVRRFAGERVRRRAGRATRRARLCDSSASPPPST